MHLTDNEAAIKLAERDNLVGELLEMVGDMEYALWGTPSCQAGVVNRCRCRYCVTKRARAVLAKAREGTQS